MSKPNVVLILADDMSWRDMGCYGQEKIRTPHLDRLAGEGLLFTYAYAGAPVCAPSRSCLMQGKHMGHATVRDNMVKPSEDTTYRHALAEDDITLAEVFQDAGYATGMFGKWGLALNGQPGLPTKKGFDRFFGYLNQRKAHNYYPPYLWHNEEKVGLPENEGHDHRKANEYDQTGRCRPNGVKNPDQASYSFDLYHREALRFVESNRDTPFFLYFPVTIPHAAFEVPELGEYADRDWPLVHRIYAAMITRLDSAVGELVALLKERGCYEDTLILFASDNGYSHTNSGSGQLSLDEFFQHAGPFKGTKGNLNQGGVRVPAFAHWPGHVPAGEKCNEPWAFFDLLPTFCELIGTTPPGNIDGLSVLQVFLGHRAERPPAREWMYWEFRDEQAVRIDDLWVHRSHPDAEVEVYHADQDPGQEINLAADRQGVVEQAEAVFASQHEPTLYFPSPGESRRSWQGRLAKAGVRLPDNVND